MQIKTAMFLSRNAENVIARVASRKEEMQRYRTRRLPLWARFLRDCVNINYTNQRRKQWDWRGFHSCSHMELVYETLMSYWQSLDSRTTPIDPATIPASSQALSSFQARPRLILFLAYLARVTYPCCKSRRVAAKHRAKSADPASEIRPELTFEILRPNCTGWNPPSYSVLKWNFVYPSHSRYGAGSDTWGTAAK